MTTGPVQELVQVLRLWGRLGCRDGRFSEDGKKIIDLPLGLGLELRPLHLVVRARHESKSLLQFGTELMVRLVEASTQEDVVRVEPGAVAERYAVCVA
jgi:hypothetical protein